MIPDCPESIEHARLGVRDDAEWRHCHLPGQRVLAYGVIHLTPRKVLYHWLFLVREGEELEPEHYYIDSAQDLLVKENGDKLYKTLKVALDDS